MFYDKNFKIIDLPYGMVPLYSKLAHLQNKHILLTSIPEYSEITEFPEMIELVILYEWSGWTEIPDTTNSTLPVIIFHNNFKYYKSNTDNCFYYPQWLFYVSNIIQESRPITLDYLITSANRNFNNGRPGKIYNYQLLKTKTYFNKILITKFKSIEPFEDNAILEIDADMLANFLLDYNEWDTLNYDQLDLVTSMGQIDLDVYSKSLFHLVAETRMAEQILSEKTYKIFLVKQIPIMCAAQHSVQHLRDIGFDMFDDIIDHTYDQISNWKERITAMHKSLEGIMQLDHTLLLHQTSSRREFNKQHLLSKKLSNNILADIT